MSDEIWPLYTDTEPGIMEKDFWEFHHECPDVYQLLTHLTFEKKAQGHAHLGISALFERARWEYPASSEGKKCYKMPNNFRAFYARLLMRDHPQLKGFFRLCKQKVPCTFWPDNDSLPPNRGNG